VRLEEGACIHNPRLILAIHEHHLTLERPYISRFFASGRKPSGLLLHTTGDTSFTTLLHRVTTSDTELLN